MSVQYRYMNKILVTGGTGYIGSHTIVDLVEHGYEVVSVDSGFNSDLSVLEGIKRITGIDVIHYQGDLCDVTFVQKIFKDHPDISGVIHFAALKAVGESVEKPLLYFRNNIDSLINVLECSIQVGVKAFVFSSSCTVYGDVTVSPVDENTPLQVAASPYGRTKQIGENIIEDTIKHTNTQGILLRYFNPAGAHPSGHIGESPINIAQNLVPVITETAIGKRDHMTVYGHDYPSRDGSCVRDYVHVCDLASAHRLALAHMISGVQMSSIDIFNLGIGSGLTVLEIISAFEEETQIKLPYTIGNRRSGDVGAIYCDNTKAKDILGWLPKYDVRDIVRSAWAWEKKRNK
jgi:UDP-glucose 4-epimerase